MVISKSHVIILQLTSNYFAKICDMLKKKWRENIVTNFKMTCSTQLIKKVTEYITIKHLKDQQEEFRVTFIQYRHIKIIRHFALTNIRFIKFLIYKIISLILYLQENKIYLVLLQFESEPQFVDMKFVKICNVVIISLSKYKTCYYLKKILCLYTKLCVILFHLK